MKLAIEKSIYYTPVVPTYYSTPIATFEYTDQNSFTEIINSLSDQVDVITFFAPRGNICYSIFSYLTTIYQKILLDKITTLFLVNRQDYCIKLIRVSEEGVEERIGILKVDSVLSEQALLYKSKWNYLLYPSFFLLGGALGVLGASSLGAPSLGASS